MKLAWMRARSDTDVLIQGLRSAHHVDLFTGANAHDFVRQHFRAPYDLCVFELDNDSDHAFAWPYLLNYGGVVLLRSSTLHDARVTALEAARAGEYTAEFTFNHGQPPPPRPLPHYMQRGNWPMLRVPLLAARITVVPHRGLVADLTDQYPDARIRFAPIPVHAASATTEPPGADDTVVAARWPYSGQPQQDALVAMAARKPVIVLETAATADWPTLDPQTWLVRARHPDPPIAISVDPRDLDHSLMLARRRLSRDADLRRQLADAAYEWWESNASPAAAARAWLPLLDEAAHLDPPGHPEGWPAHLNADGLERARAVLSDFDVDVDCLRSPTDSPARS